MSGVAALRDEYDVAVVGAGPAGVACAYYLALEGYQCTIYEALPEGFGGGMIAVGIPAYRMPRHILQRDIDIVQSLQDVRRSGLQQLSCYDPLACAPRERSIPRRSGPSSRSRSTVVRLAKLMLPPGRLSGTPSRRILL